METALKQPAVPETDLGTLGGPTNPYQANNLTLPPVEDLGVLGAEPPANTPSQPGGPSMFSVRKGYDPYATHRQQFRYLISQTPGLSSEEPTFYNDVLTDRVGNIVDLHNPEESAEYADMLLTQASPTDAMDFSGGAGEDMIDPIDYAGIETEEASPFDFENMTVEEAPSPIDYAGITIEDAPQKIQMPPMHVRGKVGSDDARRERMREYLRSRAKDVFSPLDE